MGREWLLPFTVAGAALFALAACADGEGPETVVPPGESAIEATTRATAEPPGEVVPPAIAATAGEIPPVATPLPAARETRANVEAYASPPEPEPRRHTLPTVELPDNVALLGHVRPWEYLAKDGSLLSLDLVRIYKRNGKPVRETLLSRGDLAQLPESGHFSIYASRNAFPAFMTVCVGEHPCFVSGEGEPPGPIALYESKDGGVTWGQVIPFAMPELEPPDWWQARFLLPDGRLLMPGWSVGYTADELVGPEGAAEGRPWFGVDTLYWPTIQDPVTGEEWPIRLPYEVLRSGDILLPLAVQRGPFLRVVDVADCLPVLSDPSLDAEELACAAERVLLTDLGEASEVDGRTWHRVRTPSGIEGWADGRGLE